MTIDQGAHQGPIKTSSKNVLIGGFLAACKGDALTCSAHGQSSIIEGSKTVLINGRPAARKGDKTSCGTPPEPKPVGPTAAKDQYNFISIIPKDKSREDGTAKASVDYVDIKVLNAYSNRKDKDKDGRLDFVNSGAVLTETTFKGDGFVGPNNSTNLKGNIGFSVAKGELNSGMMEVTGCLAMRVKQREVYFLVKPREVWLTRWALPVPMFLLMFYMPRLKLKLPVPGAVRRTDMVHKWRHRQMQEPLEQKQVAISIF
jgi:hypothetical protein